MKRRLPAKNCHRRWGAGVQHKHRHWHGDCACIEGQCFCMVATRMGLIANNDDEDRGDSGNIDGAHCK